MFKKINSKIDGVQEENDGGARSDYLTRYN